MNIAIQKLLILLRDKLAEEHGQDLIEYALIAGCIALGSIVTMQSFSTTLANAFSTMGSKVTSNV